MKLARHPLKPLARYGAIHRPSPATLRICLMGCQASTRNFPLGVQTKLLTASFNNPRASGGGISKQMAAIGRPAFPIVFSIDRTKCVLESPSQFESAAVSDSNRPLQLNLLLPPVV
jgi:hypothetical protein